MNDMTRVVLGQQPPRSAEEEGHLFRGMFLQKCSLVEQWAAAVLVQAGRDTEASYLFGNKLEQIKELADSKQPCFRRPEKVTLLLEEFKPFAKLRTTLAHSVLHISYATDSTHLLLFEPCISGAPSGWMSVVLRPHDTPDILRSLSSVAKRLTDQKLVLPS